MVWSFTSSNLRLPFMAELDDIVKELQRNLTTLRITGTVEEPQVKARAMSTFTTTIDEITRGRPKKD